MITRVLIDGSQSHLFHRFLKFKNIIEEFDVNLSYFSLNKLEYIIKGHKDTLPNLSQKNGVYNCHVKTAMQFMSDKQAEN